MTALTAPRKYTFERDGITKFPASSASCKEGSLIAFRPSTGYAVKWDGTADDEFVGVATKNHDSVSEIEVRTNPMVVRGYAGSSDGPHGGITVTGSSAVTDNGKPVYATDDNVLTLTANSADPVGEVVKWISGALCWVRLIPSGTNRTSAGATDVTLGDNVAAAYVIKEGSNSYLTFVTTDSGEKIQFDKALDVNVTIDHDVALTATGDGMNSATTISHASNTAEGLDVSIAQITNARTSGEIIGVKSSVTSLTGSTSGTDHSAFYAACTVGAAGADHFALKQGAGFDATIDASGCATTEAAIQIPDNVAAAFEIREAATSYLTVVSTDSAEAFNLKVRTTTTDGVSSGTAKVVGGRAYSAVSTSDNLLASAGATAHVVFAQTYSIPANTLKANTVVRIKYQVRVTDASGTDTLETKLYLGGTTSDLNGTVLMTTTAFDPDAANDMVIGEYELTARAAPAASAALVGFGRWTTTDGGSLVHGLGDLPTTNFATNGALILKVSAKWSATTASTNARLEIFNIDII